MRTLLALALLVCGVTLAAAAPVGMGSTSLDITRCLQYTNTQALPTTQIVKGLPLSPDQVREVRSRLIQYNSVRGYPGIDDLGLPPEIVAEINRRIKAQVDKWNRYPLGYPCMVFKRPSQTTAFVRQLLIDNGFRRAGLSIRRTSPRQFQLKGIQDGVQMFGIVVRTGTRQIAIFVESVSPRFSQTKRFTTSFEP